MIPNNDNHEDDADAPNFSGTSATSSEEVSGPELTPEESSQPETGSEQMPVSSEESTPTEATSEESLAADNSAQETPAPDAASTINPSISQDAAGGYPSNDPQHLWTLREGSLTPEEEKKDKRQYAIVVTVLVIIALVVGAAVLMVLSDPSRLRDANSSPSERPTSVWTEPKTGNESQGSNQSPDPASSATSSPEEIAAQNPIASRYAELAQEKGWSMTDGDVVPTVYDNVRSALLATPSLPASTGEAIGPEDAPVRVQVFSDYLCHYCQKLHDESMQTLEDLANSGDIRLEFYHFTIFAANGSDLAAQAAHAAGLQGRFWEYSDALFTQGALTTNAQGQQVVNEDALTSIATQLGLDLEKFKSDMNSEETKNYVAGQTAFASSMGMQSTPGIIVNGTYISGAYPTQTILNVIDLERELLKEFPLSEQKATRP